MIELNPAISQLDKESLCYSIYQQLYGNFFNAQDTGTVIEGDNISVRLHNTAYGFADAISLAVGSGGDGGSSSGGSINLTGYLQKSGGDMYGKLRANYGFEAGIGNTCILATYFEDEHYGVLINGDLKVGGSNLYLDGHNVISYDTIKGTATISATSIDFGNGAIKTLGSMLLGENASVGVYISQTGINIMNNAVFHSGNANLANTDWAMKDASVHGTLTVMGGVTLNNSLSALNGFELGSNGLPQIYSHQGQIAVDTFLAFGSGYGVKIDGVSVLVRINDGDILFSAVGGDLLLGGEQTNKIRLLGNISDENNKTVLVSRYGDGNFPNSFTAAHDFGDTLLSTYRTDTVNNGVIIHKQLRFGGNNGGYLHGHNGEVSFSSALGNSTILHRSSTSAYKLLNRESNSLYISTDGDFVTFGKPVEATGHIGIDGSTTRLTPYALQFTNESYIQAVEEGFVLSGNSMFMGNIVSERFASGFSGYGWSILNNLTTGNTSATFDELTVRKKMRIYELEVQKLSATNGALWISDSCSGDTVEKL